MRRVIKDLLVGALVGAPLLSIDGAILGALFGATSSDRGTLEAALRWAGYFAIAGAVGGALVGGLLAVIADRLVLHPSDPNNKENCQAPG
jgi:hypothetical protein